MLVDRDREMGRRWYLEHSTGLQLFQISRTQNKNTGGNSNSVRGNEKNEMRYWQIE
jgi:hypothetical protein